MELLIRAINVFKRVTVEPVVLLSSLSVYTAEVIRQVGIYRVVCQQTYASRPDIDCGHLANVTVDGVPAENTVQEQVSMWTMGMSLAYVIPGLFADIILGAYGDRNGRKVNMLLGITGTMISQLPLVFLFTFPLSMPLYVLVIVNLITGFTGYISITMVSGFAYLADTISDPDHLTIRMAMMTTFLYLGAIIGPLIAGGVAEILSQAQGILICQAFSAASFFFCVLLVKQTPPAHLKKISERNLEKEKKEAPPENESCTGSSKHCNEVSGERESGKSTTAKDGLLSTVLGLLKETWRTYSRPRRGNVRSYLIVSACSFFLFTVSGNSANVFALYAQKAPLSWDQETIGYFFSVASALVLVGTIVGIFIFKKLFNFTDTFIISIAGLSFVVQITVVAFTKTTVMAYISAVAGSLSQLSLPVTQSLLSKLIDPDEIGKAYTAFGVSASVAVLVSNSVYNPIYAATLSFFPGFVFLFAALLACIALTCTLWIHFDMHFKIQGSSETKFWKKVIKSIIGDVQSRASPTDKESIAKKTVDCEAARSTVQ